MKNVLIAVVAAVTLALLSDVSDAQIFRRRRNNCNYNYAPVAAATPVQKSTQKSAVSTTAFAVQQKSTQESTQKSAQKSEVVQTSSCASGQCSTTRRRFFGRHRRGW